MHVRLTSPRVVGAFVRTACRPGWWRVEICLSLCLWAGGWARAADTEQYLSPVAIAASPDGATLFVAAGTAGRVLIVDAASGQVWSATALGGHANALALAPDGTRLIVATGEASGQIEVCDARSGRVERLVRAGHTPSALAVSPDGLRLYVANRFNHDVSVIDWKGGRELGRIPVVREPVALVLTPDGRRLFVGNHLPAGRADAAEIAAAITVIDTERLEPAAQIQLPNGSTAVRGLAMSGDGEIVYATHGLGRYQMPTTQLDRGWMNTSALSVIDAAKAERINTVLVDDVDLGAANPWGVACSSDGRWIVVSHAGTHEVSIIDQPGLIEKLRRIGAGERVDGASLSSEDVPNDLSFLVGLRRRVNLSGEGPRGVVLVGERLFVAEYYSDSLGLLDLATAGPLRAKSFPLGPAVAPTQARRGEMLFNDARLCFQHWQSCASCHPDARVDGLNWDLLNDGLGNPKNTKNMLLSHETPPAMIMGVRETAEDAVRAGIRHIQFLVRPEEEAVAIDVYLKNLRPGLSPHRQGKDLSAAAQRGQQIFQRAGCAECHPPPLYTDLRRHDVGTGTGREQGKSMDTPTLIECWRTAPYLHDGRAATMRDVLGEANPDDRHGRTSGLTPIELSDLAEYVLSL
ncbi:MAG: Di-heme cytochrome c peroxidase [Verrucomicrobia bacterium ADurb.Bin006]|nr:MAG: Di-heme cytochrome c peroxidase [Verrucomicrobia bacterium ADurb.Bin006]